MLTGYCNRGEEAVGILFVAMRTNLFPPYSLLLLVKPALITVSEVGDVQDLQVKNNPK